VIRSRDLAYCGLFGAAGMLLPIVFHLMHVGHVFMPMYLPLVALAFFVSPLSSAVTALVTPLLSGALTGMPPFYPPIGPIMAVELASMGVAISLLRRAFPRLPAILVLVPVLALGRLANIGLVFCAARLMRLPPAFVAGASFLSGWPGIVLMVVAIPLIVRLSRHVSHPHQGDLR
jgi:hypothetical protein